MTVSFAEALDLIVARCRPVTGVETVAVTGADRRILADGVIAPMSVPPADNSAVDGYAFRHADAGKGALAIIGIAAAGRPFAGQVGPGQAVRIFTGALPPIGCDTIAMQEDVAVAGMKVSIPAGIPLNANIRRAGEDTTAGAIILQKGRLLGPPEIGLLASVGLSGVKVRAPLRVAVFSSGDELAEPGETLCRGAVYDANRPMLLAMLARLGMAVSDMGVLTDGKEAVLAALAGASASHDAIVTSAGVSVGDEDHIRAAVESVGGLDFQGVALKPGSPMTAGHFGGAPFFGLSGNPVAMMVNFLMLVRPGLLSLAGALVEGPRRMPVQAGFAAASKPGRREFLRAKLAVADGAAVVTPCAKGGSGILSSLVECDGLIELEESISTVTAGMTLPFIPLSELGL